MRSKHLILLFAIFLTYSVQSQETQNVTAQPKLVSGNSIYQLFPTQNYWTFIKLDTRNGKIWQVHFSIKSNEYEGQIELNSSPLVSEIDEAKGRFTLYKTENTYNMLLLDQIDGRIWQVQWNNELSMRFINRIY
jgi:hypothetical protein